MSNRNWFKRKLKTPEICQCTHAKCMHTDGMYSCGEMAGTSYCRCRKYVKSDFGDPMVEELERLIRK